MKDYVYGINKSGLSVIKLLKIKNIAFDCWDDSKKTRYLLKKKFTNLNLIPIKKINLKKYNNIYLTPGVSISVITGRLNFFANNMISKFVRKYV
mgnify:CR=1 FL=1